MSPGKLRPFLESVWFVGNSRRDNVRGSRAHRETRKGPHSFLIEEAVGMAQTLEIRLSQYAQPFMLSALDLLETVLRAEEAGEEIPAEVSRAARDFATVLAGSQGQL